MYETVDVSHGQAGGRALSCKTQKLRECRARAHRARDRPLPRLVGNCLRGSFAAPVAELEEHPDWLRLKLPQWERAGCARVEGGKRTRIAPVNGGWLVTPGEYEIRKAGR